MERLLLLATLLLVSFLGLSQTCTVTGTSPLNWPTDGSGIVCSEGGNAVGKTTLVIPAGFNVIFNDNSDTWTGTTLEVYGTLTISAAPTINCNVVVKNGGVVDIDGPLKIGTAPCGYSLIIESGGIVNVNDRLEICGIEVLSANTPCNDCGGTYSGTCPYDGRPYCQPPGGFPGPLAYDKTGYNPSLPIRLLYFKAGALEESVGLSWATTMEENFSRFVIERSADGGRFETIGEVRGQGFNIRDIESKYSFEDPVPLSGYNYYRLKAVDLDDSFEYFPVRVVRLDIGKRLTIYPNPSPGDVISFRTNFNPSEADRIILVDQVGIELYNGRASATNNSILMQTKLHTGIYMLRYVSDGFMQTARVVVRN